MFCAQCGSQLDGDEKTCGNCGASLWSSGAVRLTSPQETAQGIDDIFPEMATPAVTEEPEPVAARRHNNTLLMVVGAAVLIALVIVVLVITM